MSLDPTTFETIVPSRYITFTFPRPLSNRHLLRIAVLDSPSTATVATVSSKVAALWVPPGRESDWIFSTYYGHLQLLLSSPFHSLSRLILVGSSTFCARPVSYSPRRCPEEVQSKELEQKLTPLLLALTPKSAFAGDSSEYPEIPFLTYEDEVVRSEILEICEGPSVGEMLIENVELENKEFRRRLRFKRMPNLIQTQVRIHPKTGLSTEGLDGVEFELDNTVLVHPYLNPMVAGISVISSYLERRILDGFRPRALCLGIGGGALLRFLSAQLNFAVVGVEEDELVLEVAKKYFGLGNDSLIQLHIGDAIEFGEKLAEDINVDAKFDIVMIDLDSGDAAMGISAPPMEFINTFVLEAVSAALCKSGVLVINVIPPDELFYKRLINMFKTFFEELYDIDVGNGENYVLIAMVSSTADDLSGCESTFLKKLKMVIPESYMSSIRKISMNSESSTVNSNRLSNCG